MKRFLTLLLSLIIGWHSLVFAQTSIYTYTGAVQTYAVPPGFTSVTVDARGGCGGGYKYIQTFGMFTIHDTDRGGYGGRVVCSLSVMPGALLYVYVGGNGDTSAWGEDSFYATTPFIDTDTIFGGWNGGGGDDGWDSEFYYYYYFTGSSHIDYAGLRGGGGGGASDIRVGGTALTNRVIVAGGGGGASQFCNYLDEARGGDGGGLTGENGYNCSAYSTLYDGGGGTQSAGGAGANVYSCSSVNSGAFGIGGSTDTCGSSFYRSGGGSYEGGGGGGSGYYGGGSGFFGGGGGGSSYTDPVLATAVVHTRGYNSTLADSIIITPNCWAGAINGVTSVCMGSTTTLSDTVSGSHTWSSSNTAVATVSAGAGAVTGISAGTVTITYSVVAFCGSVYSITVVTVNPLPVAISGLTSVCMGSTTALSDATTGGTWSTGSAGIASVVSSTGVVSGAGLGTTTIMYALPTGCAANTVVTVTTLSTPITGTGIMCGGATTSLIEATSGGTWSSSSAAIASVNLTSGLVMGGNVSAVSMATITYTTAGGCITSRVVTVNPQPAGITGASSVCSGATITLTSMTGGGSWSSSNTAIAVVSAGAGGAVTVTGVSGGTATIIYTVPAGCNTPEVITVLPSPSVIAGIVSTCAGATTVLSDTMTGGYWTSSNTAVATIDPILGIVTGAAIGTTTISYILGTGCATAATVSINNAPLPIGGTFSLCPGSTVGLGDAVSGGSWSGGNAGIATVSSAGSPSTCIVYGVSAGTAIISYSVGTCAITAIVTVNASPPAIGGVTEVCVGLGTSLSNVTTGGTWSSSNASVASIVGTTGILTGGGAGTATISYTLPDGCVTTRTETVNTTPPVITGVMIVCPGATTLLIDGGGGSWSSGNTAAATVSVSVSGGAGAGGATVTGVAVGTASIIYSIGAGCSTSTIVTVNPLPAAISGTTVLCAGATTTLSDPASGGTGGAGTWSSGSTGTATVSASGGAVSGVEGGTAVITYTAATTGCTARATVTVNAQPAGITGTLAVCQGATTILSDHTTGGVWSSSATATATVSAGAGTVSGVAAGTAVIVYTNPATGCATHATVTINALPLTITGTLSVCVGATTTLFDATSGGTWSASGVPIAIGIGPVSGVVNGASAGTAVISYTLPTSCAQTATVTVNAIPAITGPTAECVGAVIGESIPMAIGTTGGTWSSSVATVATVGSSGSVTGVATGTTVITYTSLPGCKATATITVSLSPGVIIGASALCAGDTTTLSDAMGGGVWSSSNSAAATVAALSGTVTGVAVGATIITYSLGSTGCTVTKILTVSAAPAAITGGMSMCVSATTILADATTGGVWSSSGSGTAEVSAGVGVEVVTGLATGTAAITYTHGGCPVSTTVTVNLTPTAIFGIGSVCAGDSIALSDAVSGGVWTSSNTGVAEVSAGVGAGAVVATGIVSGTTTITYSLGAGCTVNKIVTVNPISAITGSTGMCLGTTTALSDAATGGSWSSGASSIASVNTTGVVTGVLTGTSVITYTTAAGCSATATVTVNIAPSAISGVLHVCAGATTALGNTAGGGEWTSSNTIVATIGSTGITTGIVPGTTTITYSLGSGCIVTAIVTVNAVPVEITGITAICGGTTTALGDASTGGVWSPAVGGIATVSGIGVVSGVSAGTVVVSYEFATGCAATALVTVNPVPAAIAGTTRLCTGLTTTLTSATTGGSWSSGTTIATADPVLGIVTGVAPGTVVITYALPSGCSTFITVTVNAAPVAIAGHMGMCIGSTVALSDPSGGGVWSSGNTGVATVSAGTVSGIGLGTATISYTVGGCPATAVVTVNSLPNAVSSMSLCLGSTEMLADLPDGGTWSSSDAGIATVEKTEGIITGVSVGTATIAYSLGAGCTVMAIVTVEALPGAVTGTPEVCVGYTTSLTDVAGGGVWSSTNTDLATVTGFGVVTGVANGPATISYTSRATGCAATRLVTVVAVPAIGGVSDMCAFSSVAIVSDAITGGTWTSTSVTVSTAGVVTPYSAGAASLTYTIPLGCYTTTSFTVHPLPGPVTGDFHFCAGLSAALTDTTAGGIWHSSNTAVASINTAGMVRGLSGGTAVISYVLPTGCMETETIIVDSLPVAGTITGLPVVCVGSAIGLSVVSASSLLTGSVWSSSNGSASVLSGVVSGISAGVDTIRYMVSNSCGSATATKTIVINPLPNAGAISGLAVVCVDGSIVLSDAIPGGVWSSSSTATVAGGVVRGITTGTDTIRYSVTNSCGTAAAVKIVTVNTVPDAGSISLLDTLCTGFTYMLTDSIPGGAWSTSNSSISISSGGLISALSAGVDTISYSLANMCGTASAGATIAVKAMSAPDTITGLAYVCMGGVDTLIATPLGGVWGSSNANVTVTPTAAGAIISGILPGADTITYAMPGECSGVGGIYPIMVLSLNQCDEATSPGLSRGEEVLRIWPNPNEGTFTVLLSANTDEPVRVTVTNIVGEKVMGLTTITNKATAIQLHDAEGVYFISAFTSGGSYEAKVVVP